MQRQHEKDKNQDQTLFAIIIFLNSQSSIVFNWRGGGGGVKVTVNLPGGTFEGLIVGPSGRWVRLEVGWGHQGGRRGRM